MTMKKFSTETAKPVVIKEPDEEVKPAPKKASVKNVVPPEKRSY